MIPRRHALNTGLRIGLGIATFFIAGCAVQKAAIVQSALNTAGRHAPQTYAGRISLVIDPEANTSASPQSFSGGFELRGNAEMGELDLLTPLGQIVMQLRWQPDMAMILRGNERQVFANADDLIQRATGAELSLAQLFAWLRGEPLQSSAQTWQVDLENHANGRIIARRSMPTPAVLRIALNKE
jgi:outer membrane lipoprotein LolB